MNPRPNKTDEAVIKTAIKNQLPRFIKYLTEKNFRYNKDLSDTIYNVVTKNLHQDPYDLTKEVEIEESWPASKKLVDLFDDLLYRMYIEYCVAELSWVKENEAELLPPKFSVDQKVLYLNDNAEKVNASISKWVIERAMYLVFIPDPKDDRSCKLTNSFNIPFESDRLFPV
jgi:hypothetical protein